MLKRGYLPVFVMTWRSEGNESVICHEPSECIRLYPVRRLHFKNLIINRGRPSKYNVEEVLKIEYV